MAYGRLLGKLGIGPSVVSLHEGPSLLCAPCAADWNAGSTEMLYHLYVDYEGCMKK